MATPTLGLINHQELDDADVSTGWSNLTTIDTDLKVEGTGSVSGVTRTNNEDSYYDNGGAPVTGVGKVLRGWTNTTNLPYMSSEATGGYRLYVFDGTSTSNYITMFGSDTYFGGWFYYWQDMDDFTGVTLANVDRWGIRAGHDSNAKNVTNHWMDVMRYLDGYNITGGLTGDRITLDDIATADRGSPTLTGYGIVQETGGVYFCTGTVQLGNGATTTWFDIDSQVLAFLDMPGNLTISAGLYDLSVVGSGCTGDITNSVLRGGTTTATRFVLDLSDSTPTYTFTDNVIQRASTTTLHSGLTATSNTFDDCGQITHAGADMSGSSIKNYEGTAGTAAVVYNVNADPDGEMDDMTFVKGTAATHAIELGSNCPTAVTLRNHSYSGYQTVTQGQNDSTIYNNSGKTVTINVANGDTPTYRNGAGATTIVAATNSLIFTGLEPATEVRVYDNGTTTEIDGVENVTTGTVTFNINPVTYPDVDVRIVNVSYIPQFLVGIDMTIGDLSIPIVQIFDRVYSNPSGSGSQLDEPEFAFLGIGRSQ